jgi:hypothetical protein
LFFCFLNPFPRFPSHALHCPSFVSFSPKIIDTQEETAAGLKAQLDSANGNKGRSSSSKTRKQQQQQTSPELTASQRGHLQQQLYYLQQYLANLEHQQEFLNTLISSKPNRQTQKERPTNRNPISLAPTFFSSFTSCFVF